jgi:hypothetical protein
MLQKIEGIEKEDRKAFKVGIEAIKGFNVIFRGTDAFVSYRGDYIVTDESLVTKSKSKKEVFQFIHDFRTNKFIGNTNSAINSIPTIKEI